MILCASMLAAPALAQSPSPRDAAGGAGCGNGGVLTFVQRIGGCSAILAFERVTTRARVIVHDWRGQLYASKGDYAAAILDFSATIRLDPSYFSAYGERADVYLAIGDAQKAVDDYGAYIRLNPDWKRFYGRGLAHLQLNNLDAIIDDFSETIKRAPSESTAWTGRGEARQRNGEVDLAIADFDRAIALDPTDPDSWFDRGIAYSDKGDPDHAIADYSQAISLKSDDAWYYNNRGNSYIDKKDDGPRDGRL